MVASAQWMKYQETGFFSKIVTDYLAKSELLKPFYQHQVSSEGIQESIHARAQFKTDRELLSKVLLEQYSGIPLSEKQTAHLNNISSPDCFTICTAHQPNIFTGHLYFIYKILHVIKIAATLTEQYPDKHFVPVYYMGSEDADLDELGHIYIKGVKYEWNTNQTGAVGRMKVDKTLVELISLLAGQLNVYPHGEAIIQIMQDAYQPGVSIEQATFKLVNILFADLGLIVLLPDNAALKRAFIPVIQKEIEEGFSHKAVQETATKFPAEYKWQAAGRELNLFYLKENIRERIEKQSNQFVVVNTDISFTKDELINELNTNPERFSPNVILRPVFQELILPNILFVGGGGELAYWLELKRVFEAVKVPYPLLVLRNSFLYIQPDMQLLIQKLNISYPELFKPANELLNLVVQLESDKQLQLTQEKNSVAALYDQMGAVAGKVHSSLGNHTEVLKKQALQRLTILEKKMLKEEKRKMEAQQRQLEKLKNRLFPKNSLQERIENMMLFYATEGPAFINTIYENTRVFEQEFCVLTA